jgi:CRISPR/Cas system-associated protein Cas10 (large subunit of type III CRISPR-Cas system)
VKENTDGKETCPHCKYMVDKKAYGKNRERIDGRCVRFSKRGKDLIAAQDDFCGQFKPA